MATKFADGAVSKCFQSIEQQILDDPGKRGVAALFLPGELERACQSLIKAKRVIIVTGFFIPTVGTCETDGPPGAHAVGGGLTKLGIEVQFVTDKACAAILSSALAPIWIDGVDFDERLRIFNPTHLIAIERIGRALDGRYYTMRAIDNSEHSSTLDRIFVDRPAGCVTIGIGDGGNEIGMGKVRDRVVAEVKNGPTIASTVATDHLIVAGVSNWGAWGLLAGLSHLTHRDLMPTPGEVERELIRLVDAGAIDGVTGLRQPTVDGLPLNVHLEKLQGISSLLRPSKPRI